MNNQNNRMESLLVCFLFLLIQSASLAVDSGVVLRSHLSLLLWERFRCNVDCKVNPDSCISEELFKDAADAMEDQGFLTPKYNLVILADCWMAHEYSLNETLPLDSRRSSNGIRILRFCSIGLIDVPNNGGMPPKSTMDDHSQYSERYQPNRPAKPCDPNMCKLPQCFCGRTQPGTLRLEEIPQMVLITFDDAVNEENYLLYQRLFNGSHNNPNGCPIGSTLYVSHEWTNYDMVQNIYSLGQEIASHSISHSYGGEDFSTAKWKEEIQGQKLFLSTYAGIKYEDIRGMRAPFLHVGGNRQYSMLYENNFTYDSSLLTLDHKPPLWPYTLDASISHRCINGPCPNHSFPGLWEIPMVMWEDMDGRRCEMFSGVVSHTGPCSNPTTAQDIYNTLVKHFQQSYVTNRAPLGLFFHSDWFDFPHHLKGFEAFLDTVATLEDVYMVTSSQLIDWMREPTALGEIKDFGAWQCDHVRERVPCTKPNECSYQFMGSVRYFTTCKPCPSVYPWVTDAHPA